MLKAAYNALPGYFGRTAPKEEALKFFEEYTAPSEQMKNIYRKQVDQIKAAQEKK